MKPITKVDHPGCPECGCPSGHVVGVEPDPFGTTANRLCCEHCGNHWVDAQSGQQGCDDDAEYQHTRCPHCSSAKTKTTSTVGGPLGLRYHRCHSCQLTFRSRDPEFNRH